jgi:hypothetical protein
MTDLQCFCNRKDLANLGLRTHGKPPHNRSVLFASSQDLEIENNEHVVMKITLSPPTMKTEFYSCASSPASSPSPNAVHLRMKTVVIARFIRAIQATKNSSATLFFWITRTSRVMTIGHTHPFPQALTLLSERHYPFPCPCPIFTVGSTSED